MESAKPQRRAAWGSISREQVIDAAERAVRAGGYDEMTIRSLASELGVSPMALYRHVRNKDDLLGEVVDRLLARRWRPRVGHDNWKAWTAEAAQRFRDFLVSEPAALDVYLRHPVTSPAAMARMQAMLEVLRFAGFDAGFARHAYGTIHTYTIGFAALEASRSRSDKTIAADETTAMLAAFTTPWQFTEGLRYLLEGIERQGVDSTS